MELGVVTVPSGRLLIVDPGYLNLWCEDRPPKMPEGILSTPDATALANEEVDLEIVGADAEAVGRELDRQWNRRFLFDIPRPQVDEAVRRVGEDSLRERLVQQLHAHSSLADRGGDALDASRPDIADGEHAADARLEHVGAAHLRSPPAEIARGEVLAGLYEPPVVERDAAS
jgi:hypothetical protein